MGCCYSHPEAVASPVIEVRGDSRRQTAQGPEPASFSRAFSPAAEHCSSHRADGVAGGAGCGLSTGPCAWACTPSRTRVTSHRTGISLHCSPALRVCISPLAGRGWGLFFRTAKHARCCLAALRIGCSGAPCDCAKGQLGGTFANVQAPRFPSFQPRESHLLCVVTLFDAHGQLQPCTGRC